MQNKKRTYICWGTHGMFKALLGTWSRIFLKAGTRKLHPLHLFFGHFVANRSFITHVRFIAHVWKERRGGGGREVRSTFLEGGVQHTFDLIFGVRCGLICGSGSDSG